MPQPATAPAAPTPAAPAPPPATKAPPQGMLQTKPEPKVEDKAPAEKVRVRGYERAKTIKDKIEAAEGPADAEPGEPKAERREAKAEPTERTESKAEPEQAPDADADQRKKFAEERQKRIDAVRAKERAQDEERQRKSASRTSEQEIEKLRKRVAELEPMNSVFQSEEALLEEAERRGMSAEKLTTWMRTKLSDPNAVAQRQAKTETDKVRSDIEKLRADVEAGWKKLEEERSEFHANREAVERGQRFGELVKSKADSHPLTASLVRRRGLDQVIAFANDGIVQYLPDGWDLDHLLDVTEQTLEWFAGGGEVDKDGNAVAPDSPAPGLSHPPKKKNGADKPVTTLSNALAAGRSTVTEEIDPRTMPLADRAKALKAKLGNG